MAVLLGSINDSYFIQNGDGEFISRLSYTGNLKWIDNPNRAYTYSLDEAKKFSKLLSNLSEYNKSLPIKPVKVTEILKF